MFTNTSNVLLHIATIAPWLGRAAIVALSIGLPWALYFSPPDYQQGETVRILYVHVPASWGALLIYTGMAVASGLAFVYRWFLGHLITRAFALVGAVLTAISLVTGAIWGLPTWGTWWVWDARLTSMLLLFFLYLGYFALIRSYTYEDKGLQVGGVLVMIGWVNIPIIKWSVDWWHTLHQPASLLRLAKPAIHPQLLMPLLVMAIGMACLSLCLGFIRLQTHIRERKLLAERLREWSEDLVA